METTTLRKVTVISTKGERKVLEFEGDTWKVLKKEVEKAGYSLSNMKAVEGVDKRTLEVDDARLPSGDFRLFLMPYKSKAGVGKKPTPKKKIAKKIPAKKKVAAKKATVKKTIKKEAPKQNVADIAKSVEDTLKAEQEELKSIAKQFSNVEQPR